MTENDARVIRTKQLIKKVFLELMKTVGFEKINIRALTEKANINRSTFYLHYTDKYDLLNQIENEGLINLKNILMGMPENILITKGFEDPSPLNVLHHACVYIKDNYEFFTLAVDNPSFIYKLSEIIKDVINSKKLHPKITIPERYIIALIVGIQTSILGEWLKSGMKESPDEIIGIISTILKDIPKNIFEIADI